MNNDELIIPGHSALMRARIISQQIVNSTPQLRNHLIQHHPTLLVDNQKTKSENKNFEVFEQEILQKRVFHKIQQWFDSIKLAHSLKQERNQFIEKVLLREADNNCAIRIVQKDIQCSKPLQKSQSEKQIEIKNTHRQFLQTISNFTEQTRNGVQTFRKTMTAACQQRLSYELELLKNSESLSVEQLEASIAQIKNRKHQELETNIGLRDKNKVVSRKLAMLKQDNQGLREIIERQKQVNAVIKHKYQLLKLKKSSSKNVSPQKYQANHKDSLVVLIRKLQKIIHKTRMERISINKQRDQEVILRSTLKQWLLQGVQQLDSYSQKVVQSIKNQGFPEKIPDQFIRLHPQFKVIISKKKSSSCNRLYACTKKDRFYKTQSENVFKPFESINSPRRIGLMQQKPHLNIVRMQIKRMLTPS